MSNNNEGGGNAPLSIDSGVIGGSTGGATEADLARGYTREENSRTWGKPDPALNEQIGRDSGDGLAPFTNEPEPGFLGRPEGWER